ncbi:MAG: FAD-binding oxidoreductase, partial [Betaproteobacteria bacterium]
VLAVRAMTVEPEPQIIELHGPEAMLLHHTYGTNGIVLELEVALAPAVEWTECIATFDKFDDALEFADRFGSSPGLEKKEVCFLAAPIPQYFTSLAEHLPADQHAVLMLVAPHSEAGMRDMVAQHCGQITYRKTADEVAGSHKTLLEYTWNHTTLHALKVDKGLTYIQSGFNPMHRLKQVKALEAALKGEVMMHLEFLRTKEGAFNCSGLQIIRYTTEERLNQIMQIYRDHGVQINNPHVYIVEDGKQNHLDPAVVGMKRRFDPQGLLNPGKLRSWYAATQLAPETTPARQTA